ncbi:MAG: amidase [Bacteroidetes bacterium HGW-Bacteroidetes-17]|nr:MAG: amidase [Bacteroidetes bacterium HGW-Bacteroidetes-17]
MKKYLLFIVFVLITSLNSCNYLNMNKESTSDAFILEEATIADIHKAFKNGSLTAEKLVNLYIARVQKYDQSTGLNSIILINPKAIETARELDKEFQETGELRPLHGIPMIVKDNYNTQGLQTTAGSLALKGFEPKEDAFQIKAVKAAGAIVLAKSNMAEWAFSPMVTISSFAGETLNPYNLKHVPAGSSGGTAASVAANFGAVGFGTDTGNSIRGPGSHNSLVGFRSTLGLTSREGIAPLYLRNDVGGPLARTVTDATRILEVIAGYDPNDPITIHSQGKIPDNYQQFLVTDGLKGARIGILRELSEKDPNPEIKALFEQAIEDLKRLGAEIIDPIVIPGFDTLRRNQWCSMFKEDVNNYLTSLGDDVPVKNLDEIIASGKYAPYIEGNLLYHQNADPEDAGHECSDPYTDSRRIAFRKAIEDVMDSNQLGAIIYPTWNNPPALVGDFEGYKGDNSQIIAPHTGQPAFTIPMGFSGGNLPAGLQFLGRMYDEPTLIKYCFAYEQGTMHRKAPELFPAIQE